MKQQQIFQGFKETPPPIKKGLRFGKLQIFRILDWFSISQNDIYGFWGVAWVKIEVCFSFQINKFTL